MPLAGIVTNTDVAVWAVNVSGGVMDRWTFSVVGAALKTWTGKLRISCLIVEYGRVEGRYRLGFRDVSFYLKFRELCFITRF